MADPNLANVVALAAQIRPALERGDRAGINEIVERLIALRAPMGGQWEQLAYLAAGNGELSLAKKAIDLQVEAAGGGNGAQFHKAAFLSTIGATRDADALLRSLPENVPNPATNAYVRGISALALGRAEEARQALDRATRMMLYSGMAWLSLAMTVDFAREPDLADRLIAAGRGIDQAPSPERAPYHYALGKAYADRGEHADAFAAFARGARLMKATMPYDHAADRAEAARAVEGYDAARIAAISGQQSEPTGRTIFVTGLPRSGTTLVEQILTSHSAVDDGGESSRLVLLAEEMGGASWPALARAVETQGVAPAARLWDHWLDELYPATGRIVDKSVNSSRFLGLVAALLPDAPLIWMTRDPLDQAWSCFRTNFAAGAMPWSYDLNDIAAHFRLEDRLLTQWREILGDRLLVLSYEDLVTEPDGWIRRILAHCGLAEEAQPFAPHENRRPVPTASMMQVRRPINRAGIGAAEPYRALLAPFIEAWEG
ncbi:sulfotransferase [Sphingomonas sp. MMS24-J13]|uniref:tetratricopeptide repeat-containing sulfotransferase family protein n=1 Tax=Sphingomonas sp. MMS24-J13 TaxID=3238686 RepID=UPI00384EC863